MTRRHVPWWRVRVFGLGTHPGHHYPGWAPKVLWHRFTHWAIGPLMGCSCTRCFHSKWRIAELEDRVRELLRERAAPAKWTVRVCPECGAQHNAPSEEEETRYCMGHEDEPGRRTRPAYVVVPVVAADLGWRAERRKASVSRALREGRGI